MYFKAVLTSCLYWILDNNQFMGKILLIILENIKPSWRYKALVPYVWMDQETIAKSRLLMSGFETSVFAPCFLGDPKLRSTVQLSELRYRQFLSAKVSARGSNVFCFRANRIVIERVVGVDPESVSYATGLVLWQGKRNALINTPAHDDCIEKGIFLSGNGSWNYYHWLIEILPKCQLIEALPSPLKDYPLLVSEDVINIASFITTLDRIMPHHSRVIMRNDQIYCVDDLVWIDTPNNLPFNMKGNNIFKTDHCRIRSETIAWLRDSLMYSAAPRPPTSANRIFLKRKTIRRLYNQDEVEVFLQKYGFASVDMEELSFDEQVAVFSGAKWIVGPTGAAWTNLVFAQSNAIALCWMASGYGDFSAFSTLAGIVGVNMNYITYDVKIDSTGGLYSSNYAMKVEKIKNALHDLGLDPIN